MLPKKALLSLLLLLKKRYLELEKENLRLQAELDNYKLIQVNKSSNQPSSKQGEWEPKGVGNDGKDKKKGRGKKGRKGAGNRAKNCHPTRKETARVEFCSA